jgi:CSLREA domain-containing protein
MNPAGQSRLAAIFASLFVLFIAAALSFNQAVTAAPRSTSYTVNTELDTVDANPGDGACATAAAFCSLRAAVQETNALGGAHTVLLPAGTYTLTIPGSGEDDAATGDLDVKSNLTIIGQGLDETTIDGNKSDRVFHVRKTLDISGLTVTNGYAIDEFGGGISNGGRLWIDEVVVSDNLGRFGGGISNFGTLTITHSSVLSNTATTTNITGGAGGGLENLGLMTVVNSTIAYNIADNAIGGGMRQQGEAYFTNSTISSNSSSSNGGGIFHILGGIGVNPGLTELTNVTITNNDALLAGGGIYYASGTVNILNSIVAHNKGGSFADCNGPLVSQGFNLIESPNCSVAGDTTGNIRSEDALLEPLSNNGGSTQTHALNPSSPAVDAISGAGASCPASDQRSAPRDSVCDMGAYEYGAWLEISYSSGSLGSTFAIEGYDFMTDTLAAIDANGVSLGSVNTDGAGKLSFQLTTGNADEGDYLTTATTNPSASVFFSLDSESPLRKPEGSGVVLDLPAGIALDEFVFVPVVNNS